MSFADTLRRIDYNALGISDYSHNYILRLIPILDYYLNICNHTLDLLPKTTHTLIDYGGGHGFFSLLAKQRGIKRVVYIDHNLQASETVTAIAEQLGFGPDIILTGDSNTLKVWCKEQNIIPDSIVGIDVIEHIYRLDTFFADLLTINPNMAMVFSTASTPYNPIVKHRLRRIMLQDEYGYGGQKGFLQLRREHISALRPDLSQKELDQWAESTRGLTYDDITTVLHSSTPPDTFLHSPKISFFNSHFSIPNTCDPATGSWTERILPMKAYSTLVAPHRIKVHKGFYNSHQKGIKGIIESMLNLFLHLPLTRPIAPFIILEVK